MVGSWFCKSWKGRYDFVGPFKEKKKIHKHRVRYEREYLYRMRKENYTFSKS